VTYNLYESLFVPCLKKKYGNKLAVFSMVFAEIIQDISIKSRCHGYLKSVLLSADHVISSSKYCAGLYDNFGIAQNLIKVIYVGVDVAEFSPDVDDSAVSFPADPPHQDSVVLFLGRFLRDMGLDVILDAIPAVLGKNDNVSFLLAGAHGELDTEANILQQKYPDKVFIAHNIPNSILPAYYRKCTILVAPTKGLRACMGLSIKEAMACAKPAIVSDSGGIVEAVVPGKTGVIIPLRGQARISPADLACELLELLGSPELLRDMGRAARERALELFDKNVEAETWLGLMCGVTHDNCE
jgi:glycosyltransferase involved in cell wall biosynthesis